MSLLDALRTGSTVIAAELRPPRAELDSTEGMDAWIDLYHAIRGLARQDARVFLTDSAVGTQEENNLRHLVTNLGHDVSRERVVPFLTSKHSFEFCLTYAEQAWQSGFTSLVVLGGDKAVGRPRCVEHASELRRAIRGRAPRLALGGWANPYADAARQVGFLVDEGFAAEYYLTQIVSHLNLAPVERFLEETRRRHAAEVPGMFGVFYYRSATPKTLRLLSQFLPVPVAELEREFAAGATPVDVCARTLRAMMDIGARHFYISNLPLHGATATLTAILEKVGDRNYAVNSQLPI
jgi:5,10-methylenetetrahydrofolate reductase